MGDFSLARPLCATLLVFALVLANCGGKSEHNHSYDCRPCELGWLKLADCEPEARATLCEKCADSDKYIGSQTSTPEYETYCRPIKHQCELSCPENQFRVDDCDIEESLAFSSCLWCDKATVGQQILADYKRQCVPPTTTRTTIISRPTDHVLSEHDIAHGHGQQQQQQQQPMQVAEEPKPTTTEYEEEVVYEDSPNAHGDTNDKASRRNDTGSSTSMFTLSSSFSAENDTIDDDDDIDANVAKSVVENLLNSIAQDEQPNAAMEKVDIGAIAAGEGEGEQSSFRLYDVTNYAVHGMVFGGILLVIFSLLFVKKLLV